MKALNNVRLLRRSGAAALMVALLASTMVIAGPAKASHDDDPDIDKVKERGQNSVTLRIEDDRFKNDKTRIKVTITNKRTGEKMVQHFNERLNKDGEETIRITGLAPNTEYKFKVRVKKAGKDNYKGSDSKTISTRA